MPSARAEPTTPSGPICSPDDLAFPPDEYATRLKLVSASMRNAGLDAILATSPENICYLTGFESVGYFNPQLLIVTADGRTTLITRALELANARASGLCDALLGMSDHEALHDLVAAALGERGLLSGRIGLDLRSRWLGVALRDAIVQAVPAAAFADGFGFIEAARLRKSERELAAIRVAGRIAAEAMRGAFEAIRSGRSERDVAAAVSRSQIAAGSDWTGMPFFIASGPRSARAHVTWSNRTMGPGDPVFLETNAAHRRYHAAIMRSAFIGRAPDDYRSLHAASVAGLEAALAAIRPGVPASAVDRACRDAVATAGWGSSFRLRSGYSMGLGFDNFGEPLLFSLHQENHSPLEAGMVLHLVPYLSEPTLGGVAVSETVIVSAEGAEPVSSLPRHLVER